MAKSNDKDGATIGSVRDVEKASLAQQVGGGEESVAVDATASTEDLPLSKARCVALVAVLTIASIMSIFSGRLADIYGRRRTFLLGSSFFTAASIMLPFVPNESGFDAIRGLQGLSAAAMASAALGILSSTFPPGQAKDVAFSFFAIGAPLGFIFGNPLGSLIGEHLPWQWTYWILSITAGICTAASYSIIPRPPPSSTPSKTSTIDWIGAAILTLALIFLVLALSSGNEIGWRTPWIPTLLVLSFLLLASYTYWHYRLSTIPNKTPFITPFILTQKQLAPVLIISALLTASYTIFLTSSLHWLTAYKAQSTLQITFHFLPAGICALLVAALTPLILSRIPGLYILLFSTICISLSCLLLAIPLPEHTTYWAYGLPAKLLCATGIVTAGPVLTLFVAKMVGAEDAALGAGLITGVGMVGRVVGGVIATAVEMEIEGREKGVVLAPGDEALKEGIRGMVWFGFAVSVVAVMMVGGFLRGMGVIGGKRVNE
ncbi:hypothetical protein COCC4DRAFT_144606 [Bipolaris maydis ATCC 48331]|uniref:Major facilitator superfamily (MFS) profile domain-containing protein n=2 Tax=Cochliobolus heterostrophus TaxID=5016 RepID=M2UWG6_COCH5|nr:uncharacterized protein COCC4DRAFT_144606 [Bipolaris maydis ATCC 48331]EMD97861.1 hypothetical protein COCHEDRAFT_1200422 [Bipolaris maydis C5]ENI02742.1 hypothetical protein COCC4DRAFT_144606 [Bipolaris maydis ATCC 48331]KAJ6202190.1 major facilitator superfamily domain-containing protein [Bipolaris maydis]KAJ6210801.1 major facilitator superfamily domain-containing protein [Bipolaris maydis]